MINKIETKPLEKFNFSNGKLHIFESLNSKFWDSDNIIQKKYKSLKIENQNENILEESLQTLFIYRKLIPL